MRNRPKMLKRLINSLNAALFTTAVKPPKKRGYRHKYRNKPRTTNKAQQRLASKRLAVLREKVRG